MENNWEYDYTFLYKDRPPQGQNTTPGSQGPVWEDPHHSGKPKKHWGRRIAAGALALIVCAGVGAGSGYLGYRLAAGNQAQGYGGSAGQGRHTVKDAFHSVPPFHIEPLYCSCIIAGEC